MFRPIELVLRNQGQYQSIQPIEDAIKRPWLGRETFKAPFDAAQAELNRTLYPHLFDPRREATA